MLFLLIIILLILLLNIIIYYNLYNQKIFSDNLVDALTENIDFINDFQTELEIHHLKKIIKLYSQFQIILRISKCDYVSFFKYNYAKKYVDIHFILSVDSNGFIIQESLLDNTPVASNFLTLDIMNSSQDCFNLITESYMKDNATYIYNAMRNKEVKKMYYNNIYKNSGTPFGFLLISYKDDSYELSEKEESEVLKIIDKIKSFL